MKLLLTIALLTPALAQNPTDADANAFASQQVKITRDWNKMTTSGIAAELRQTRKWTEGGRLMVKYVFVAKGAPKDKTFSLLQWPVTSREPVEAIAGVTFNSEGVAMCDGRSDQHCGDPAKKDDEIELAMQPAKGEIFRFALVSEDQQTKVFASVVPDPIIAEDGTCSVEIVRLMPHSELIMLRGHGFQPSEKLKMSSKSYDEQLEKEAVADSNGEYYAGIMPFVKGKSKGDTLVKIQASHCAPKATFHWGS